MCCCWIKKFTFLTVDRAREESSRGLPSIRNFSHWCALYGFVGTSFSQCTIVTIVAYSKSLQGWWCERSEFSHAASLIDKESNYSVWDFGAAVYLWSPFQKTFGGNFFLPYFLKVLILNGVPGQWSKKAYHTPWGLTSGCAWPVRCKRKRPPKSPTNR